MIEGVDFSFGRPGADALVKAGKKFVVRYVPYPGDGGKGLTATEVSLYKSRKLDIVLVFETTRQRPLGGLVAGAADARTVKAAFASLKLPSAPVYFAVDWDATQAQQTAVDLYLRGVAGVLGSARVGVYGGYNVIMRCKAHDTAKWFWQTYAWSAGKIAPGIHLYQYSNGRTINGAAVDYVRAMQDNYGQLVWLPDTSTAPPPPPPAPKRPYDGMPVLPTDDIDALHAAGYWMKGGRWVKGAATPPPPVTPPATGDRNGTPVLPTDNVDEMHAAGYWMLGGKWVRGEVAPVPVPPAPVVHPPINTVASERVAVSSAYPWVPFSSTTVAGLPAWAIDGKGASYLWVHGGPYINDAVGQHTGELLAFAQRVASKGGHRHYGIDYRAGWNDAHNATNWVESVADIVAAAKAIKAFHPTEPLVIVAHSWAGALCAIATLRDGAGDAYAPVNAISSTAAISTITSVGMPDIVGLAANRPSMPVAVITGATDYAGAGRQDFVNALAKAGHPGIFTVDPGDHTGTLGTDETANTLIKLLELV